MIRGSLRLVAGALFAIGLTASTAAASEFTCRSITASGGWQSAGVTVADGDAVCVVARGLWSHGPEAGDIIPWHGPSGYLLKQNTTPPPIVPFPFAKIGALLGKLGDTALAFPVDDGLCFIAQSDGNGSLPADLQFAMNDVPASFADNHGALRVAVTIGVGETGFDSRGSALDRLIARASCLR
jgi:hypothetical protein